MKITTETGSVYNIDRGLCLKSDSSGTLIDSFKVYVMKVIPDWVTTVEEIYDIPNNPSMTPEVGKRLYLGGKDSWWISTRVIEIEE